MNISALIKKYAVLIVLILMVAFFSIYSSAFFTAANLMNIIRQVSMLEIVAVGMTFVLLTGGIDLSVGSQISFIGVLTATLVVNSGLDPLLACVIGVAATTVIGLINGLIVTRIGIPPLIATLSMMTILKGVSYITCGGLPVYGIPDEIKVIGQGYVGALPIPVIIMLIITMIGIFVLRKTYIGRYFYAVGSNDEAAKLSGLNTHGIQILVYMLCGFFTGIAGLIMLGRISSGQPVAGNAFEMDVLTAVVLGGVSVVGGKGTIIGAFIGVLIMGVLNNGLIIIGVDEYYQLVIKGLVLLIAVGFDSLQNMKKGR